MLWLFTVITIPVKKNKTFSAFLSSYGNTSRSLGEQEIKWQHDINEVVSMAFSIPSNRSQRCLPLCESMEKTFSISFRKYCKETKGK